MRLIILILLLSLAAGYYLTYHFVTNTDQQWYVYFVTNDLKAFLISCALMVVTWKTKNFPFAVCAGTICLYDLATQVMDLNQKGNWADIIYKGLLASLLVYALVKLCLSKR